MGQRIHEISGGVDDLWTSGVPGGDRQAARGGRNPGNPINPGTPAIRAASADYPPRANISTFCKRSVAALRSSE